MVGLSFALNNRVNALWSEDQAGDAARAETLADTALALQPDDTLAHNAKAMVFFIKRQWKAAISQAAAALADDPAMRPPMRTLASGTCFSVTARTVSSELKLPFD